MAEKRYPSERQDQFIVRLPDGMRDRIRVAAETANRSMNAEIVARLERSFERDDEMSGLKSEWQETHARLRWVEEFITAVLTDRPHPPPFKSATDPTP